MSSRTEQGDTARPEEAWELQHLFSGMARDRAGRLAWGIGCPAPKALRLCVRLIMSMTRTHITICPVPQPPLG